MGRNTTQMLKIQPGYTRMSWGEKKFISIKPGLSYIRLLEKLLQRSSLL